MYIKHTEKLCIGSKKKTMINTFFLSKSFGPIIFLNTLIQGSISKFYFQI